MQNRWYKEAVFYQIYPRSFKDSNGDGIGDIGGIISKIDYLCDLGVNAIWFSPLYASPNADYGYDISDYKAINPEYGTMEEFDEMVKLLHQRGIKVVMDLVINHTSDKHKWFEAARNDENSKYRDYYYFRDGRGKNGKRPPNNWTSFFVGKAWQYDEIAKKWYLHLFDKDQPDLNYFNPEVMNEIKQILRFWLDKGVDGFRCDVITLLSKTQGLPNGRPRIALTGAEHFIDGPRMLELLGELKTVLDEYDAYTVGESVFIDVEKTLKYSTEGSEYLTTVFSFDHTSCDNRFGIKQLPKKFSLKQLKKAVNTWQRGLYGKSWNTLFWENHDCARIVGRYVSAKKPYREKGAKMLANVLLTLSGTPFIYQGQELGTTSIEMKDISQYKDVDALRSYDLLRKVFGRRKATKMIAYCSRDNARTPVQWTGGKNAGFTDGDETWLPITPNYTEINAEIEQTNNDSVLNYYKKLIKLRRSDKALVYGTYQELKSHGKIWAYLRESQYGTLVVVNNFSLKSAKFKLPKKLCGKQWELLAANYDCRELPDAITLKPYESAVFKLK